MAGGHCSFRHVWRLFFPPAGLGSIALGLAAICAAGALAIQVRTPADTRIRSRFLLGRLTMSWSQAHATTDGNVVRRRTGGETRQTLDVETENSRSKPDRPQFVPVCGSGFMGGNPEANREQTFRAPCTFFNMESGCVLRRNFMRRAISAILGRLITASFWQIKELPLWDRAKAAEIELLPGFAGKRTELWRIRIRRSLTRKIQTSGHRNKPRWWAPPPGRRTFLGRSLKIDFQRSGTYHVLVVSGFKVGILALVAFWLLRRMRANDGVASAITILLITGYALLTDVGTPVWRAALHALRLSCRQIALSAALNAQRHRGGRIGLAGDRSEGAAGRKLSSSASFVF